MCLSARTYAAGKWEVLKCNLASLAKAAKDGAARWEDKMKGEVVL